MKKDELGVKEALEILAEKQPISLRTFNKWCDLGLIKFRREPHGRLQGELGYRKFKREEIERVKALLTRERRVGYPILPRPK